MTRRRPFAQSSVAGAAGAAIVAALLAATLARPREVRGGDPKVEAPPPSFGFYLRRIAPYTDAHCAKCHRLPSSGALRLEAPVEPADGPEDLRRREREFESLRRLVSPEYPWGSRLLRKVLSEEDGGLPHAGGALLRLDDDAYDDLLDFASGATTANLPPVPDAGRDRRGVRPGEDVVLDGSLSYDRDDDRILYRWSLLARPPGSRAALTETSEPKTTLRVDAPGTYVVHLRVSDGKVWSPAWPVTIEVLERVGPEAPDAVKPSGLAALDAASLRRVRAVYGDVLGRPPTPPEAIAHAGKPSREVAAILLATVEAGRALVEDEASRLGLVGDAEPQSFDAQALPFHLAAGERTPAAVVAALVQDPAWRRAHPPGESHARAVARLLLDREPTAADLAAYGDGSRLDALVASREFATAALRRFAARFLPAAEADVMPAGRASESTRDLALAFVASPSWGDALDAVRRPGELQFVRALFADLFGRRPTSAELVGVARGASAISGGAGGDAGRAAVVDVVLDSGEAALPLLVDLPDPAAWVADRFVRALGRQPSDEEARVYKAALLDPAGGPHLVVRALLTSPEYAAR